MGDSKRLKPLLPGVDESWLPIGARSDFSASPDQGYLQTVYKEQVRESAASVFPMAGSSKEWY